MKGEIALIVKKTVDKLFPDTEVQVNVEYPDRKFGDYATNVAFLLSKQLKKPPREIALQIAEKLQHPFIEKVDVAGPGFINITMNESWWHSIVKKVLDLQQDYGNLAIGEGKRIQVEFVSANPTGPLHVGHGRGAAVGDSLARILKKAGYQVEKEYYINDAGRQIRMLGESIWARCMELKGEKVEFPEDGYHGSYIVDLAKEILETSPEVLEKPKDEAVQHLADWGKEKLFKKIIEDLKVFNVTFDSFFSEKKLHESGEVAKAIEELKQKGFIYEKEGALWFKSSEFGDEKDRVVVRANGEPTYFAADIAYHRNKMERGYDLCIDVWGADHHGYIPRVKAAIAALGYNPDKLQVLLIQMVNLLRDGKPVVLSKRAGEIVTLRSLIDEVGTDATRFIFLTRKCDSHLDFDIEVAKRQTEENPVFYVQYAHARICSIKRTAEERDIALSLENPNLSLLQEDEEKELMRKIAQFPDVIESCARSLEPHRLTYYLAELASQFHAYYNKLRVLVEDEALRKARYALCEAVRIVIKEGLSLLGVSAPEAM
ncbi:arginyl-tRNA synthetase [Thermosulfidibacter takaii ABI70S6]|uniref:Arginine--tRNA ligase n=1 Tax=Thermosulfidibacter takaii (strain DSM 17441 / JCM 13301 / NBRC 103674 / ABI70S6) TaxID=1298851 RepID=A0A0S3QW31_THET7|nr:arginine--tRNA ligase [Thermosulfidibacter takaii]BAT72531.1 arginyl-tRNA synthetase [Thermosulfidibacter takaii ABI70S6]